jgi:hypothetical protein
MPLSPKRRGILDLIIMTILPIRQENVPLSFTLHFHLPICSRKCSLMFKLKWSHVKLKSTQKLNRLVLSFFFWLMIKGVRCGWFYNPSSNFLRSSLTPYLTHNNYSLGKHMVWHMWFYEQNWNYISYFFKWHLRLLLILFFLEIKFNQFGPLNYF